MQPQSLADTIEWLEKESDRLWNEATEAYEQLGKAGWGNQELSTKYNRAGNERHAIGIVIDILRERGDEVGCPSTAVRRGAGARGS